MDGTHKSDSQSVLPWWLTSRYTGRVKQINGKMDKGMYVGHMFWPFAQRLVKIDAHWFEFL